MLGNKMIYFLEDNLELRAKRQLSTTLARLFLDFDVKTSKFNCNKEFKTGEIYEVMYPDANNIFSLKKVAVVQKSPANEKVVFVCPLEPMDEEKYDMGALEIGKLYLKDDKRNYVAKYREAIFLEKEHFMLDHNDISDIKRIGILDLSHIHAIRKSYQKILKVNVDDKKVPVITTVNYEQLFSC